jgi:hypothetical protein
MDTLEKILELLAKALRDPSFRKETVHEILRYYFKNELLIKRSVPEDAYETLGDLAYDLNYFVAEPARRAEDPSYYGDERLEQEIRTALQRLSLLGVDLKSDKAKEP